MAILVMVNPWGWRYYTYSVKANLADRSLITEWQPIWRIELPFMGIFAAMAAVLVLVVLRRGWGGVEGIGVCLFLAVMALPHYRHFALLGLAWCILTPAGLTATALGRWWDETGQRQRRAVTVLSAILIAATIPGLVRVRPWQLPFPTEPAVRAEVTYPVGAVNHLESTAFRGNLMTPFLYGAYVSWRLYPAVKVSLDSRYEVAYPMELLPENLEFYSAKPGWRRTLEKYATDAVLAPRNAPVGQELSAAGWFEEYADKAWAVYRRP